MKPESILGDRKKALLDNIQIADFQLSVALERVVNQKGESDLLVVLTNSFAYIDSFLQTSVEYRNLF